MGYLDCNGKIYIKIVTDVKGEENLCASGFFSRKQFLIGYTRVSSF